MRPVQRLDKQLEIEPQLVSVKGVRLRHYESSDDIVSWLSLRDAAFEDVQPRPGTWARADFQREFLSQPWWRPERMWLAETTESGAGRLVGSITLARRGAADSRFGVIHWLCVEPSWRRRGVGTLLLLAAERDCWDQGWHTVGVETHSNWLAAREFYQSHGYTS